MATDTHTLGIFEMKVTLKDVSLMKDSCGFFKEYVFFFIFDYHVTLIDEVKCNILTHIYRINHPTMHFHYLAISLRFLGN